MKGPAFLVGPGILLLTARVLAGAAGLGAHVGYVAGTSIGPGSWFLGPLFVTLHLLFVVVLPILVIAGTVETLLLLRARKS